MTTRTQVGRYYAVTDRAVYPKPPAPLWGAAGSLLIDPTFGSIIRRFTDAKTRGDKIASYRTPSSPHCNAFSVDGSLFWITSTDGTIMLCDPKTCSVIPSQGFQMEPAFSRVTPELLFCVQESNLQTVRAFNLGANGGITDVINLGTPADTYVGVIDSSAIAPERLLVLYGGTAQDLHHLVIVLEVTGSNHWTFDSQKRLGYPLHHVAIDRSGRYVMLYPTSDAQQGALKAPQSIVWDIQSDILTMLPLDSQTVYPMGHDGIGYGVSVNQDSDSPWDAVQWQFRSLATPLTRRDVLPHVLTPEEIYVDGHTSWNNATPDNGAPFFTELYRYGQSLTDPWRAFDDEIIAVAANMPDQDPIVHRFCHHRSSGENFWDQPRVNVAPDGRSAIFTSNWENSLGTDPSDNSFRQDVFLLQLAGSVPGSIAHVIATLQATLAELETL